MEFFNRIDLLKKYFLEFAEDHYNMALNIFEEQVTFKLVYDYSLVYCR